MLRGNYSSYQFIRKFFIVSLNLLVISIAAIALLNIFTTIKISYFIFVLPAGGMVLLYSSFKFLRIRKRRRYQGKLQSFYPSSFIPWFYALYLPLWTLYFTLFTDKITNTEYAMLFLANTHFVFFASFVILLLPPLKLNMAIFKLIDILILFVAFLPIFFAMLAGFGLESLLIKKILVFIGSLVFAQKLARLTFEFFAIRDAQAKAAQAIGK